LLTDNSFFLPFVAQVRRIDSDVAGYMRQTQLQSKSDWRIAYLSQQQLRSFNLPYQLGFSDLPDTPNSFETPVDADTASIPGTYETAK
jgi:hypothetical protein